MQTTKTIKNGKNYWEAYELIDGKRVRGGSCHSKKDAIANFKVNKDKYFKEKAGKTATKEGKVKLSTALNEWYILYKGRENGMTPATVSGNMGTLRAIAKDPLGNIRVCDITRDDIQRYLRRLSGLAVSTRRQRFFLLRQYFDYFYMNDPGRNPCAGIKTPREQAGKAKQLNILSDEDMLKLADELRMPRNYSHDHSGASSGYRNGAALVVAMYLFLREGEVMALRKSSIDFEHKVVHINTQLSWSAPATKSDTGIWVECLPKYNSVRSVPMFPPVVDLLKAVCDQCGNDDDFLFRSSSGNHLTPGPMRKTLNTALEHCGLPHLRIHDLRHTGISALLRNGIAAEAVQTWAGHKSLKETLDTYYIVLPEQVSSEAEKACALYSK